MERDPAVEIRTVTVASIFPFPFEFGYAVAVAENDHDVALGQALSGPELDLVEDRQRLILELQETQALYGTAFLERDPTRPAGYRVVSNADVVPASGP